MNGNASGGRVLPLPPEAVPILSMASAAFRVFPASFGAVFPGGLRRHARRVFPVSSEGNPTEAGMKLLATVCRQKHPSSPPEAGMKPEHSGILIPGVVNSHTRSVDCPLAFSVSAGSSLRGLPDKLAGVFPVPVGGILLLGQFSELVVGIPRTHGGSLTTTSACSSTGGYSSYPQGESWRIAGQYAYTAVFPVPARGSQVHFRAWRH